MEPRNDTPKYRIINRDTCKYLAIFFMFWGHLFAWIELSRNPLYDQTVIPLWQQLLIDLSLLCPPVMFFMIADGFRYTRSRPKYALRLFLLALVTVPCDLLLFGVIEGNIILTLLCSLLCLMVWESGWKLPLRILAVTGICMLNFFTFSEWYIFAELIVLFLHIFRERPKARAAAYFSLLAVYSAFPLLLTNHAGKAHPALSVGNILIQYAVMAAAYLCMTVFYNGKKGKHPTFAKWFFYVFYPLHIIVIWVLMKMPEWIF